MDEITVEIEKLVNGGQGLGFYEGRPVFAWNALPGETAVIKLTKKKKDHFEGIAVRINAASPERVDPEEDHFMSCSPWQIMNFAHENHWKKEIAKETFKRIGGLELPEFDIVHDQKVFGYRNKAEYGFCAVGGGRTISLGLHERGAPDLRPIDKCLLGDENINKAAVGILAWLNREKVSAADLVKLVLRANRRGQVVASLVVADQAFRLPPGSVCDDILTGFHLYFSHPSTRTGGPLKHLRSVGRNFITEKVAGKTFKCGPLSFFQVNVDVFEKAVLKIGAFVDKEDEVVDFYSGVGTIGIALSDRIKGGLLIESNTESANLADENIHINELENLTAREGSAENMLAEIKKDKTIIFDPPRAGLHPEVVGKVLEVLPRKLMYLSCDAATQARDLKILNQKYEVTFFELYNFFPRTPHIESLLVLTRD